MKPVPEIRLRDANDAPVNPRGAAVVYWMIAARRTGWNFGLQRAVERARELQKPLVVLEALRCGYRWASDRFHRFVLEGMTDNAKRFARSPALHYPYVETHPGEGRGLLEALAARACLVVTDRFPAFFLPRMVEAAAKKLPVRLETVDSNGLLPLAAGIRTFPSAHVFRRFLQKTLRRHLVAFPAADPLRALPPARRPGLPAALRRRWPAASPALLAAASGTLARLPLDHAVGPAPIRGGAAAGGRALRRFLRDGLQSYADDRNHPDLDAGSGLSPYLHFGHVSAHEVVHRILKAEGWTRDALAEKATGSRRGWWGLGASAEEFLDQAVTWRELGFNVSARRADLEDIASLPGWARDTLGRHEKDPRPSLYDLDAFTRAATHDPLWNAAQRQLLREGRIHNYLRMLWGKKILEWSETPRQALAVMLELNNRFALDGRDPNSSSGISWILGRFDRPWGPERQVFGTVRYMSSESAARKLRLRGYLQRFGPEA